LKRRKQQWSKMERISVWGKEGTGIWEWEIKRKTDREGTKGRINSERVGRGAGVPGGERRGARKRHGIVG
jgi:hypothetical protein